jgi:hypothetical protein
MVDATSTTPPRWATRPVFTEAESAAIERYQALTPAERDRVRRLICLSGAPLDLAVSAVEATRPQS